MVLQRMDHPSAPAKRVEPAYVVLICAGAAFYLTQEKFLLSPALRAVLFIGLLGGFTTFSSFGLQTFTLLRDGQLGLAALNVTASNLLGLLMVWIGYVAFKSF